MATKSILECNCKDAYLTEGFKFVEEKRGSVKVENDGQVHDLIDQKFFLIQTLLKRLFSYDTKIDLGTQSITVDRVFNGVKNLIYIYKFRSFISCYKQLLGSFHIRYNPTWS